jgi:type VI secretion system protein ImpE
MTRADELLRAGDVVGARQELFEQVRANPSDERVRMFLFQLCSLVGEWERAKAQLQMLAKLDPKMQMLSVAYNQCIDAEAKRAQVFAGETLARILADADWAASLAEALAARAKGEADAADLYDAVFDAAPTSPGTAEAIAENGAEEELSFDWIADADPRLGPATEAMIAGNYGLMPFAALESLEISEPVDLRDTVWLPAQFSLRGGAKVAGFIPARYPGSETAEDPSVVLGRSTTWHEDAVGDHPLGHRLFVFSDGSELPLQQLRRIRFAAT